MARTRSRSPSPSGQASLLEQEPEQMPFPPDEQEPDEDEEPEGTPDAFGDTPTREADEVQLNPEPLFSVLLKRTLAKGHTDDNEGVLRDYTEHVVPRLSDTLAHHTAKGGDFARQKREEGRTSTERYSDDQSLRAHLVNGLFPAAQVARTLRRWGVPSFEDDWDEETYRLFCAGYTLHDWIKLPDVKEKLEAVGLDHTISVAQNLPFVENTFRSCCQGLGLDQFLDPIGGVDAVLHDLIFIACNTQRLYGTLRNLAALSGLRAGGRKRELATKLCTLADLLAYIGRTPVATATDSSIGDLLETLSNGMARLTYHHLADVRGVLTNLINNAAMETFAIPDVRETLLYAPTGVVYLERKEKAPPPPDVAQVAEKAVAKIRGLCQKQLAQQLIGFGRDGKGLKHADYYWLFFSPHQLPRVAARAAMKRIIAGGTKQASAPKRFAKMRDEGMAPAGTNLDLPEDIYVDRLAELCALLVNIVKEHAPGKDAQGIILGELGLSDIASTVDAIPSRGGTPYPWYYAAGVFRQRTPGLSDPESEERLSQLADAVAAHLPDALSERATGWDDLRRYVTEHLSFGSQSVQGLATRVTAELTRYQTAQKSRGGTTVCSLCSAHYKVGPQQESAILFAPQVYTNRQPLHGSKAVRHMCAVCGMELMLRQVLMNTSSAVGKRFEGRRFRYLFFYPSYFFTTETLGMLRDLQTELRRISFTTLRKLLLPGRDDASLHANLSLETFQHIQDLLLDPTIRNNPAEDRIFRLRYDEREPMTFSFLGIPPAGRDAKDAEAWIHPAFLALVLPLLLDMKVVASEGMLPLFNEATELPETVFFDSPHQFVSYLTGTTRLNLNEVGPALQRLTAAYLIHLDGNARSGAGGYDYRWSDMVALARDLETSPLYAFHYMMKGVRRGEDNTLSGRKAELYIDLVERYIDQGQGDLKMSHARNLTLLYRQFYRHKKTEGKRPSTNSILRPIDEAARALLGADTRLFNDEESLYEMVKARLEQFLLRVEENKADGQIPNWIPSPEREKSLDEFSRYIVETIYRDVFGKDVSAFAGKQLNLLRDTCASIYMAENWRAWRERGGKSDDDARDETGNGANGASDNHSEENTSN